MKLWEVLKELTDDPTKVFERNERYKKWTMKTNAHGGAVRGETYYFILDCEGEDSYGGAGELTGNLANNDDDWQLVRQPVTWQEAVQAWEEGNNVTVEFDSIGRTTKRAKGSETISLSRTEINEGIWYVED